LLIQCVPAFLIALHWSRLRAGPVFAGIVVGTLFSAGLSLADVTRLGGVHVGVVGCALNTLVAVLGSLLIEPPAGESAMAARASSSHAS